MNWPPSKSPSYKTAMEPPYIVTLTIIVGPKLSTAQCSIPEIEIEIVFVSLLLLHSFSISISISIPKNGETMRVAAVRRMPACFHTRAWCICAAAGSMLFHVCR